MFLQVTGTITAPAGNPRIDRVVVDRLTGVLSVVTGTLQGDAGRPRDHIRQGARLSSPML